MITDLPGCDSNWETVPPGSRVVTVMNAGICTSDCRKSVIGEPKKIYGPWITFALLIDSSSKFWLAHADMSCPMYLASDPEVVNRRYAETALRFRRNSASLV